MPDKPIEPDAIEVPEHSAEPPSMDKLELAIYEATPGSAIVTNIDEIIERAVAAADFYKSFDVASAIENGQQYKDAKASRTEIRNLRKAIDDARKDIKRRYEEPLKAFEAKVKEATGPLDEADAAYKMAIERYDEERSKRTEKELREHYYEMSGDLGELVSFEDFMELRAPKMRNGTFSWLRPSANPEASKKSMEEELVKVRKEWDALPGYDEGDLERIRAHYCETLDMAQTLTRIKAERDRRETIRRQREERERWERERAELVAAAKAEDEANEKASQEAARQAMATLQQKMKLQPVPQPRPMPQPMPIAGPEPTPAPTPIDAPTPQPMPNPIPTKQAYQEPVNETPSWRIQIDETVTMPLDSLKDLLRDVKALGFKSVTVISLKTGEVA